MKILKLHEHKPLRLGHKKVNKNKLYELENQGQLNLFKKPGKAIKILDFGKELTPFEIAFKADEAENESAPEAYLKSIEQKDRVADAYCNLGIIEAKKGNDIKAIDYFSRALINDARHYETHFNLANIYFDNGNLPLAKLHYQTAIEIEPNDPNIYFNLGLVQALSGDTEEALISLNRYVSMVDQEDSVIARDLIDQLTLSNTTG
jgi:tetratricopeptide (TPR) repeat protein